MSIERQLQRITEKQQLIDVLGKADDRDEVIAIIVHTEDDPADEACELRYYSSYTMGLDDQSVLWNIEQFKLHLLGSGSA